MSDAPKPAIRRTIRRDPVVPKFHVEDKPPGGKVEDGDRTRDRTFLTETEADAWSTARYKARHHVAKTKPDLSDKRAETLAFEIAEALHACSEISADDGADAQEKPERSARDSAPTPGENSARPSHESGGMTNGAGSHHG